MCGNACRAVAFLLPSGDRWLKETTPGFEGPDVLWNFAKFLVVNGKPVRHYRPKLNPLEFEADIVDAIASTKA